MDGEVHPDLGFELPRWRRSRWGVIRDNPNNHHAYTRRRYHYIVLVLIHRSNYYPLVSGCNSVHNIIIVMTLLFCAQLFPEDIFNRPVSSGYFISVGHDAQKPYYYNRTYLVVFSVGSYYYYL